MWCCRWYRQVTNMLQEVQASSVLVRPLQSVLQFPRAQPEDAAHYVCTVSSMLGEDRREMSLAVTLPLAVHMRPQQQVVDTGTSATFNCSVTGTDPHISWLKDGRIVVDSARISILLGGQVLMVRAVKKEDRGMYQCMVRSGEESAQSIGELVLGAVAPEMLSTFIEQTLQPGPPVSLRCVSSGNPSPRFTWQLDGGDVLPRGYILGSFLDSEGNVVSHLNISSARVLHGGLYACVARNLLGTAHHSAALNVYGPPTPRLPHNLTAVAGMDVYLRCPVAGFPISSVTWQRTGTILPSHMRQKVLSNGTLLIKQVDGSSDRGEYLCSVTNQQGQSAQGRIYLDVMSVKEKKQDKRLSLNDDEYDDDDKYDCNDDVFYHLYENDDDDGYDDVDNGGDEDVPNNWPSLRIGRAGPIAWPARSPNLSLLDYYQRGYLKAIRRESTVNSALGQALVLQDADVVQEQRREFGSTLMFSNLAARHSGHYTCIASNAAATANYTAQLVVRGGSVAPLSLPPGSVLLAFGRTLVRFPSHLPLFSLSTTYEAPPSWDDPDVLEDDWLMSSAVRCPLVADLQMDFPWSPSSLSIVERVSRTRN
ncbi:hypothetical protein PR048_027989 [Dryococelus australis]|uniref:Ig-like domain-containing protein n=1 Tax=Dryococelus australis TaxID=614101 RepID=A0ABQ9GI41_9NEOP|nr:hypothetical protein PR048_027989 [Dryococelus australis]